MSQGRPAKLVLAVIDALKPSMLERAIATGRAPALKAIAERGTLPRRCVSAFPSITADLRGEHRHRRGPRPPPHPRINWYHRDEARYVEYGSSFQASRAFGVVRSLTDTIYNMNLAHLARDVPTIFESLDDAGCAPRARRT